MNITDKIEEIRQKPEHIRLRYVWLAVAISMAFILIIWFISLKSEFGRNQSDINLPQIPAMPTLPEKGNVGGVAPGSAEGFNFNSGDAVNPSAENPTGDIGQ